MQTYNLTGAERGSAADTKSGEESSHHRALHCIGFMKTPFSTLGTGKPPEQHAGVPALAHRKFIGGDTLCSR